MRLCKLLVLEKYQLDVALQESHELPLNVCSCCGIIAVCVCVKPFQGPCNLDVVMCVRCLVQICKALYIALFFCSKGRLYKLSLTWRHVQGGVSTEIGKCSYLSLPLRLFKLLPRGRGNC